MPVSAYAVALRLSDAKLLAPPTIYRALEFLEEAGFVRHVALPRAYVRCELAADTPLVALLRCTACGRVSEAAEAFRQSIEGLAMAVGFNPRSRTVEIEGRCVACYAIPEE